MSIHVVHVEDEKPLRNILGVALRTAEPGIQLHQFGSAEEAIPYIQQHGQTVDLFVLDVRLPGTLSGFQIAQKVRDLNCPGHIVITSAYSPPPQEFLTQMRAEYLPKPWHLVQLTEKLLKYKLEGIPASVSSSVPSSLYKPAATAQPDGRSDYRGDFADILSKDQSVVMEDSIFCPVCEKPVETDHSVCANCGYILQNEAVHNTMPIPQVVAPTKRTGGLRGEAELGTQQALLFQIGNVSLELPPNNSIIIGRVQGNHPDAELAVDLTPYGAEQCGLSRRHIKLTRRGSMVYVSDLGSMNGTWLNGRRLTPNTEHPMRDGDELRMSSLTVRIAFKTVPPTRPLG